MEPLLKTVNAVIWGIPVLLLILTAGVILSVRSRFVQIRLFPNAVKQFIKSFREKNTTGNTVTGYRALCTALAATVGTGNIAGVAGAIALGGPGVLFWMWICAIFGMITKFAEVSLAVNYRHREQGTGYVGGPMFIIQKALSPKCHYLAYIYCFFGIVAALGIGNAVQVNAVIDGISMIAKLLNADFGLYQRMILGIIISVLLIPIFSKGAKRIGEITEVLVPVASVAYILIALAVLCTQFHRIPAAICSIIRGAFSPSAVTGGMLGSAFLSLRIGVSRGVFTNEAGMGTASIAHAASNVTHPAEQGLMGIIEVFVDTIVICTLTGLVILCSGVVIPYGSDPGISLTLDAFSTVLGNWTNVLLTLLSSIFAFATILGWGLYGARCCQFIFGINAWRYFAYAQAAAVILGSVLNTSVVWILAEIVNGLMAIPNLYAVCALSGIFIKITKDFQENGNAYRLK